MRTKVIRNRGGEGETDTERVWVWRGRELVRERKRAMEIERVRIGRKRVKKETEGIWKEGITWRKGLGERGGRERQAGGKLEMRKQGARLETDARVRRGASKQEGKRGERGRG